MDRAVGVFKVQSADDVRIVYANEDFGAVFRCRPAEIIGRDWGTLFDPEADGDMIQFIGAAFREERSTTFVCRQEAGPQIGRFARFSMTTLDMPELDDSAKYWLWIQQGDALVDRSGSALESETLRAILRSTLDPIVTTSDMGQILTASDSIERVLGWRPADIIGRSVNLLIADPHRDQHDEYMARYRRTGVTNILGQTRQVPARHRNGHDVSVEISVSRVDLPEREVTLFIGIIHDITERIESERELDEHREHLQALVEARTAELEASHAQLRQADRLASMGTLAAGLGHDMNNILLPMRCRLESLAAGDLSDEVRSQLDAVHESIKYLQQLSDGLHMLALDPHDRDASTKSTNLSDWWDQVGMLLGKSLPSHVRLAVSLPTTLPEVAVAPHRLTQAVLNLIVNSGEAVGEDGTVRIVAQPDDDPTFIRLIVRDNGTGMTPSVIKYALDPFFTTKKRGLGTGLGLSLVHGMVRSVGGAVELASEPGRGSTVTLQLPIVEVIEAETVSDGGLELNRVCITIEDPRIASLITAMLNEAGLAVCPRSDHCPETCGIWIADARLTTASDVAHMAGNAVRQIIIIGSDLDTTPNPCVRTIRDANDFELLRQTIGDAVAAMKGVSS